MRKLKDYACLGDPEAYVPILPAGTGEFGDTVCQRVMTPNTVMCNGQKKTLSEPE